MPPAFALSQDQTLRFISIQHPNHKPRHQTNQNIDPNPPNQTQRKNQIEHPSTHLIKRYTNEHPKSAPHQTQSTQSPGHKPKPNTNQTQHKTNHPIQTLSGQIEKGRRQHIPSSTDLLVNEHLPFGSTGQQRRRWRRYLVGVRGTCQRDDSLIPPAERDAAMRNRALVTNRARYLPGHGFAWIVTRLPP